MDCKKIRELLSEYIDGTLDAKTRDVVEEHLKTCKGCKEELEALKACIREVSSLKGVKAPGDFLERVHQRIEQKSGFRDILRRLFIPLQVKIPLEVAAVVATVLLVVHITNRIQPIRDLGISPVVDEVSKLEKGVTIEKPLGAVDKIQDVSAVPKEALEPAVVRKREEIEKYRRLSHQDIVSGEVTVAESLEEAEAGEEELIELSLLVKADEPGWNKFFGDAIELEPKKEAEGEPSKTDAILVKTGTKEYDKEDLLDRREKIAEGEKSSLPKIASYEVDIQKDTKALSSPHLDEVISRIRNITELVEGEVLHIEYIEETSLPHIINVEIPASKYALFLKRIGDIGTLESAVPIKAEGHKEIIPLRIKLIPSE